jgi:fructokinase
MPYLPQSREKHGAAWGDSTSRGSGGAASASDNIRSDIVASLKKREPHTTPRTLRLDNALRASPTGGRAMIDASKPLVIGLGELLWDLLPGGKQLGGAPANFAYHAHALGAEARVISAVGRDTLGDEALARLEKVGLETEFVLKDSAHATGTVEIELNADGQPRYTIIENVAWDFIPATPAALRLAARADAVCFGSLAQRAPVSRESIRSILHHTASECLRIFDINLRPPFFSARLVRESIECANALKLNDEELLTLAEILGCAPSEEGFIAHLFDKYAFRLIALTRGANGAMVATPHDRIDLPAEAPAPLADTVGAGDAFTAAITVGWLRGWPLAEIGAHAIALASFVCSRKGAMPDMREFTLRRTVQDA